MKSYALQLVVWQYGPSKYVNDITIASVLFNWRVRFHVIHMNSRAEHLLISYQLASILTHVGSVATIIDMPGYIMII